MPKVSRPPRNIDTSVYLYDWLPKFLILPDSATSFKPAYKFKEGRLIKILSVERRLKQDGSYRCNSGLRVVVCDANSRIFAILSSKSINQYEQDERIRVTKNLINTEIFVTGLNVNFLTPRQASQLFGYSDNRTRAILGGNSSSLLADIPAYAILQIENFRIGNRDRYIPQNVDAIPYIYTLSDYQKRYLTSAFDNESDYTSETGGVEGDSDELKSQ